jgi:hypothetical protein
MTNIEKLTKLVLTSETVTVEMRELAYAIETGKKTTCVTAEFFDTLHKKLLSSGMLGQDGIFTDPITGIRYNSNFDSRDFLELVNRYFAGTSMALLAYPIAKQLGFCHEGGYKFVKLVIQTYREVYQK